jgi:uncharacterized protein (TIGR04255 family)
MPFPDAPRVIYDENPLDRVICQVRFPPILGIDANPPADFQEIIRAEFPEFHEKKEPTIAFPSKGIVDFSQEVFRQALPMEVTNYEFSSEDGLYTVNLTRTFLALTAKEYKKREQFKEKLNGPLRALIKTYKPAYFSRIGLRYIDVIQRSLLNLDGVPWNELLKPHILGLLSSTEIKDEILSGESKYEVRLDGNSIVRIATNLAKSEQDEECFVVDSDFFCTSKTKLEDLWERLNFFHDMASRLIQYLIMPRLHDAMKPERI